MSMSHDEEDRYIDLDEFDAKGVKQAIERLGEVERKAKEMYEQVWELYPGMDFEPWALNNYPDLATARHQLQRAKDEYWAWRE